MRARFFFKTFLNYFWIHSPATWWGKRLILLIFFLSAKCFFSNLRQGLTKSNCSRNDWLLLRWTFSTLWEAPVHFLLLLQTISWWHLSLNCSRRSLSTLWFCEIYQLFFLLVFQIQRFFKCWLNLEFSLSWRTFFLPIGCISKKQLWRNMFFLASWIFKISIKQNFPWNCGVFSA